MFKVILLVVFILSGCSHFKFSTTMCDQIASEPNAVMPTQCKSYDEQKAAKAFYKIDKPNDTKDSEIIKFQKQQE